MVSAGLIYLLGLLPAGLYWHYVLKVLGQDVRLANTLRAYYIGHLGKYVPGKAMVVILRTGMVRGHRVDTAVAAASVFFETLTMMAVGAFLAAGILPLRLSEEQVLFLGVDWFDDRLRIAHLAADLPISCPPGRGRKNRPAGTDVLSYLSWKTLLVGWVCMFFHGY